MAVTVISIVMAHNTSKTINKFNIAKSIGARYYNTNETYRPKVSLGSMHSRIVVSTGAV